MYVVLVPTFLVCRENELRKFCEEKYFVTSVGNACFLWVIKNHFHAFTHIYFYIRIMFLKRVEWITNSSGHKYNFVASEKNYCWKVSTPHTTNSVVWKNMFFLWLCSILLIWNYNGLTHKQNCSIIEVRKRIETLLFKENSVYLCMHSTITSYCYLRTISKLQEIYPLLSSSFLHKFHLTKRSKLKLKSIFLL